VEEEHHHLQIEKKEILEVIPHLVQLLLLEAAAVAVGVETLEALDCLVDLVVVVKILLVQEILHQQHHHKEILEDYLKLEVGQEQQHHQLGHL
jgi:hypothetical protein